MMVTSLLQHSNEKDELTARVTIFVDDGEFSVVFERTQVFIVSIDPFTHVKSAVAGPTKLKIIKTSNTSIDNSEVIEDETDVANLLKQYFDESIYDYYFFDGENLKNYFVNEKNKRIKESIHNISQVTLLTNTILHINTLHTEKARQVAKIKECDTQIYDEIKKLKENIEKYEKENVQIKNELTDYKKKYQEADDLLRGYGPIKTNTSERKKIELELNDLKKDFETFITRKLSFIREYMTLLNLYPRVKNTFEMINKKQDTGTLPPSIDKEQVKLIIEKEIKNCPVCNAVIDEKAIVHLKKLLTILDVSSATSNYLMEIKSSLELIIQKCNEFPEKYEKFKNEEKKYIESIESKTKSLENINSFLSNYSSKLGEINVSKIESDRSHYNSLIINTEKKKVLNENNLKVAREILVKKENEKEQLENKIKDKNNMNKQIRTLRLIESNLTNVQKMIMDKIKSEIQELTWDHFSKMIWKKNTFGKIIIDDSYSLSVYNTENREMTGSLSATEYMALAYSFTLAIHEASGKNCPLVVDSPLGRVSDENRANMASVLLKVSENKQIIMLFTPDEYSEEVKKIYDLSAASIKDIILSDDESEIAKVGE